MQKQLTMQAFPMSASAVASDPTSIKSAEKTILVIILAWPKIFADFLTWYKVSHRHCGNAQKSTENQVDHERVFPAEAVQDNKCQEIGAQLDAAADHEIQMAVST